MIFSCLLVIPPPPPWDARRDIQKPTIPLIYREPTYATIQSLHKLLNVNAASVSTNLGCNMLGHLCLTLYPNVYETLSETTSMTQPNTRAKPIIPVGATGPEAASLQYSHDTAAVAFNTFQDVDPALRQQLIGATKENFVHVLHTPHLGYSVFSMLDLLTHPYATYTIVTNADWLAHDKRFRKLYTPTPPLRM